MPITKNNPKGGIALITLLTVAIFGLGVMTTLSLLTIGESRMTSAITSSERTFYAAESGINEALYRIALNPVPQPFSFTMNDTQVDVTVTNSPDRTPCAVNPDNPYPKIIQSKAEDKTGKIRTVQIIACSSAFSGGFDYAVQAGSGGIFMDPNSVIRGKVYSNANITGGNNARILSWAGIEGEAWVALSNTIDNVDTEGDVHANGLKNMVTAKKAYYANVIGSVKANGGSDTCLENENGPNCFDSQPNPPVRSLPITDSDVQTWKDAITGGGAVLDPNPAECPAAHAGGGTYCVTSNTTLGNVKINGNLYVGRKGETGDGAILTLTGNLWVAGNILFDNNVSNGKTVVDSSLGAGSAIIFSDHPDNNTTITVDNNYPLEGSGDPRSFILIVSTSSNGFATDCTHEGSPAIFGSNNSSSIIFAAIHGMLKVKNNGFLNAAAVEKLCLENNATVTFNPNIASFTIPSGGGDTVGTALGTWQEQ